MKWPGLVGAILIVGIGCKKTEPTEQVDRSKIGIVTDPPVVRTDQVGRSQWAAMYDEDHPNLAKWEREATFVLVDAENRSDKDVMVTLGGSLLDGKGATVSPLHPESLRVPPGGRRTFALLDKSGDKQPTATTAAIEVRGAAVAPAAPSVTISDGHLFNDHGKVMIAAEITNTAARQGDIMVFAGFHGEDGRPMERQHMVLVLAAGASQTARFVGPEGSKSAYLFLGDTSY